MHQWEANEVMDLRSKLLDNILIGGKQGERELLMRASAAHEVTNTHVDPQQNIMLLFNAGLKNFRQKFPFLVQLSAPL